MKNFLYCLLAALLLFMNACNSNNLREDAPHWDTNAVFTALPLWNVNEQALDITSSMNIIASVEGTMQDDQLAALSDGVCVGKCVPVETKYGLRFFLTIFQPVEPTHPITLAYFCSGQQLIYYWINCISFTNDAVIGMAGTPYVLKPEDACNTMYPAQLSYTLNTTTITDNDELALFDESSCRMLLPVFEGTASLRVDLNQESENFYIRYYSDALGKIFTSEKFTLTAEQTTSVELNFQ